MKTNNQILSLVILVLKVSLVGTFILTNHQLLFAQVMPDGIPEINKLAKWSDITTPKIANSQIFDNGTNIGIGTIVPASKLTIQIGNYVDYTTLLSDIGVVASDI